MRFARLQCDSERVPAGLAALAAQELDFLQLDYDRPKVASAPDAEPIGLPRFATGITQVARALVKPLFLDPDFRIITSAGWGDVYGCVERIAAIFAEGRCADIPLAAVRGSNLLPLLETLTAEGVDLNNAETGAAWSELRAPILAADLRLGGGPIATALAENARVIVAGCYDDAAPAAAWAVQTFDGSWRDYDRLAAAAVAARAAAWRPWNSERVDPAVPPWQPGWVELEADGRSNVNATVADDSALLALQRWLHQWHAPTGSPVTADVRLNLAKVSCEANGPRQISIIDAAGAASDDAWRLEILYQVGYRAEVLVEFAADADPQLPRRLAEVAKAHLFPEHDPGGLRTVEPLRSLGDGGASWLHLAYHSTSRQACQCFADRAMQLASAPELHARLAAGAPRVQAVCGVWPARVPRDAVDIAVETRPAREWL